MAKQTQNKTRKINKLFRKARINAGLTQDQAADKIGCSRANIRRHEEKNWRDYGKRPESTISYETVKLFAGVYGVRPSDLGWERGK